MDKRQWVTVLPAFAIALALPAWAGGTQNPTQSPETTKSESSASTGSQGAASDKTRTESHGPTAIMDRATSAEKSPEAKKASEKHPPTNRMDQATSDQKSPDSGPQRFEEPTRPGQAPSETK